MKEGGIRTSVLLKGWSESTAKRQEKREDSEEGEEKEEKSCMAVLLRSDCFLSSLPIRRVPSTYIPPV